jgi:hypothetical protein
MASMTVASLLSIPSQPQRQAQWLVAVASLLQGYRSIPLVLRHQVTNQKGHYRAEVEVRRRSQETYLPLTEGKQDRHLWLDGQGRLWHSHLQRRRWIRQHEDERIYDEVFQVTRVAQPEKDHLERALSRLIGQHGPLFWQAWEQLDSQQHERLISVGQSWEVLQPALQHSAARAQALLPMLLSAQSHPASRLALLEAGSRGDYAPPAETLPWLLLQVEWNISPGILGLARASLQRYPQPAWLLRTHPNPVVRRRLAQLLPNRMDWLSWLMAEADPAVRQTLRLRVQEEKTAGQIVEQLNLETNPARRSALGWLLLQWSGPFDSQREQRNLWKTVHKVLNPPQREALKKRRMVRD